MDTARIAKLLQPFLGASVLTPAQLNNISTYIDLLIRWNAHINLTAIREPEEIVTRHFGESLFAARHLFPLDANDHQPTTNDLLDLGSGAGFPGLPIKIWSPDLHVTLIESNQKKVAFLREAARALTLTDINVISTRAEDFPGQAQVVTLRAVERFELILPTAARLVAPNGRLALLIGQAQVPKAREIGSSLTWDAPIAVPRSNNRVLLVGSTTTP